MTTLDGRRPPPLNPTLLTPEVIACIATAVEQGMYIERACVLADVSKPAFYSWLKAAEDPEGNPLCKDLANAVKKAESLHQQARLSEIRAAGAQPHNWMAAAWQLERRYRNEYALQPQPGSDGSLQIKIILEQPRSIEPATDAEVRVLPAPEIVT